MHQLHFFLYLEPFVVAYVQTTYTVIESKGQVEVCVNLTHPVIDMSEGNVHVAAFNDEHSAYIPPNSALASRLPLYVSAQTQNISFSQLLIRQMCLGCTIWIQ